MPPAQAGSFVGLVWDDEVRAKLKRIMWANPRAGVANIAASFKVSHTTMRRFLLENPEAMELIEIGRAAGDNMIAEKNFSMAIKGDSKAMDREMKKRGMIGTDLLPVMQPEQKRDYSRLSVEELEQLAAIDAKTRPGAPVEGAVREIAPPLHP